MGIVTLEVMFGGIAKALVVEFEGGVKAAIPVATRSNVNKETI